MCIQCPIFSSTLINSVIYVYLFNGASVFFSLTDRSYVIFTWEVIKHEMEVRTIRQKWAQNCYCREFSVFQDLSFILKGLARLLNNPLVQTYLPRSTKRIHFYQELLILFWKFCDFNKVRSSILYEWSYKIVIFVREIKQMQWVFLYFELAGKNL